MSETRIGETASAGFEKLPLLCRSGEGEGEGELFPSSFIPCRIDSAVRFPSHAGHGHKSSVLLCNRGTPVEPRGLPLFLSRVFYYTGEVPHARY